MILGGEGVLDNLVKMVSNDLRRGGGVLDNLVKMVSNDQGRGILNNLEKMVSNDQGRGGGTGQPGENGE